MNRLNIVITGATGLIGQDVLKTLKDDNLKNIISLSRNKRDGFVRTDYSISSLLSIFKGADIVVHLAAIRGRNGTNGYADYLENELLTANVLEAMKLANVKRLIYISSISVYNSNDLIPWSEDSDLSPDSFYGLSKLFGEKICNYYTRFGIKSVIFRCAHVLAYEDSPYMLSKFLKAAANKETLKVFGESKARREFIYVKDVSRAILFAIKNEKLTGIFNLGIGHGITNYELANKINTVFENKSKIEYKSDCDEGIKSSVMTNERLIKEGFNIKYSYNQALIDIRKEKFK